MYPMHPGSMDPNTYNPQQPQQMWSFPQNQQFTNKIFVSGIEEVKQKQQAFNSSMLYLDNYKPIVYEKTVDGTGQYNVKMYNITECKEETLCAPEYALKSELKSLQEKISMLEGKLNESVTRT